MELRKITINGNEYEFVNSSRNTRTGFAHDSRLFKDNREIGRATCIYYNRTWECYTYQTVMQRCINNIVENRYNRFIENYKAEHNIKRMTAEKRAEAEKLFDDLADIKELKEVYKQLELNEYGT